MAKKTTGIALDLKSLAHAKLGRFAISRSRLGRLAPRIKRIVSRIETERATGAHAYRQLPYDQLTCKAIEEFASKLKPRTENLVVLGIGGSALGNIALSQALNPPYHNLLTRRQRGGPRLFVVDNIDPQRFGAVLRVVKADLSRTVFNVISKSGETAETAAQFMVVRDMLVRKLGAAAAAKQIVAITDTQQGTLRRIVSAEGYASLPVPDGVGGRFSVLSAVGLFSAAMCGIDIRSLLKGAVDMDQRVSRSALNRNPAALFAAVQYLCYRRGQMISVMMPYSDTLFGLADWYRQLWAESLGKCDDDRGKKKKVNIGPTPVKALGATDQHSQIQLYREGPNDKIITFIEAQSFDTQVHIPRSFKDVPALSYLGGSSLADLLQAEKQATEGALIESQRPCMTIRLPRIDAYHVGQFIYMLEAATTIMGRLFGVNPYDQPGVELGKKITYHLMGRHGYEKMPRS